MLLRVDRDSVCMGDDVEDHATQLDVDGESPVGAAVTDVLNRYRLAHVAGEVAWRIQLRSGRHEIVDGRWRSPKNVDLALLHVPHGQGEPTLIPLAQHLLNGSLRRTLQELPGEPTWMHFAYIPDGEGVRRNELAQYHAAAVLDQR